MTARFLPQTRLNVLLLQCGLSSRSARAFHNCQVFCSLGLCQGRTRPERLAMGPFNEGTTYGHLEQWSILPRDGAQCRVLFSI
jgi:hypothetical protein